MARRRWRWWPGTASYGPRLAQVVVTRRCNLSCGYCNEYDQVSKPVATEVLKQRVDHLADLGLLYLEYTGGETLLHPDIVELVRHGASYRFDERWIITNGYLLSADLVKQLNDAGLTHLQISIDGVTPNATTVKVLKPLRAKLAHLERHASFTVQVNAVLGAGNDEEVLEVMRYAQGAGFRARASIIHDGTGAMSLDERGKEIMAQVYAIVGKRWEEAGDYRARMIATGAADFKCRAGSRYLYVDEHGVVHWCSQQRGVFTKPLLDYGPDDLREQFHTRKDCAPTCTVGCVRTASKWDEWRAQDRPDPRAGAATRSRHLKVLG
ncbi:MAG TPA: radical SAM protein [Kofleriaceae bacterium]|nr:radical SAM protein [Kofleriaceae bacterium]